VTPARARPKRETWLPLVVAALALFCVVQFMQGGAEEEQHRDRPLPSNPRASLPLDPEAALQSVANALPSAGAGAQGLHVLEVRALVARGKLAEAKARAADYFARWPNGPDTATLEALTGAHPGASTEAPGEAPAEDEPAPEAQPSERPPRATVLAPTR
jgi:hypothetical protein